MNLSIGIALAAAVIAAAAAGVIAAQGGRQTASTRVAGLLIAGASLWGVCDVLRLLSPDADWARRFASVGALGWCFIAPLTMHFMLSLRRNTVPGGRTILPYSYLGSLFFVAAVWVAPRWMFAGTVREPDGWVVMPGPGVLFLLAFTLVHVVPVLGFGLRAIGRSASPSDQAQLRWIAAGVSLPIAVVPLTNVLFPLLGQPSPRLGSLAFALFGAVIACSNYRHGTTPLARGGFAGQIVDAHPDGVALVFLSGEIGSASEGLARLIGESASALEGKTFEAFLDPPLTNPRAEMSEAEAHLVCSDGKRVPVAVSTRLLADRRGMEFGLMVVVRDLREVVTLRTQLVTSGRLASMGQLAAGIAHEINNPMAFVRTNLTLLQEHWGHLTKEPPSEAERQHILAEGEELLEESLEGVERACAIVRDVNAFSHAGTGQRSAVDLHALLENVLRVASPHLTRIELETRFGDIPPALGASQELKQVFLNLLLNAAQATGEGGSICVETREQPDAVEVCVRDDGCGIDPRDVEKVFDPFFTTKPVGEGTGMGLFISYQIVRNHGGEIRVASEPGQGTRLSVFLPKHGA